MKKEALMFLLISLISFTSAINVDFNCPQSVQDNAEFSCSLKVTNFSGVYDLKVDIFENGKRISKIWNEDWKSTNYYVKNFITDENPREVRLILNSTSKNVEGVLKLRESGKNKVVFEENFSLDVLLENSEGVQVENDSNVVYNVPESNIAKVVKNNLSENENNYVTSDAITPVQDNPEIEASQKIINLNSPSVSSEVVYKSKNEKIKEYSIYAFALFLVFIIVVLVAWR